MCGSAHWWLDNRKVAILLNPTDDTVYSLIDASKLSEHDARTCVYWRLAARHSEQLSFIPALALVGPAGSGKTTIMEALCSMPGESSAVTSCSILTAAATRDLLATYKDKLFVADEFDDLKPEVAHLFMARTTRSMADIVYKELVSGNKYKQAVANVFGPTIIHIRNQLDNPARSSRAIQVFTKHSDGPYGEFNSHFANLNDLEFDMGKVQTKGGRILTTWSPVLEVARQLEDYTYLAEVQAEIDLESHLLREKAEFDNATLVLSKIVEYISEHASDQWARIDIEAWIGRPLRFDFPYLTPLVINNVISQLGFHTERKGGRRWLYPEPMALKMAAIKRSYHDDALEELVTPHQR